MEKVCGNCKYSSEIGNNVTDEIGFCRFNPPHIMNTNPKTVNFTPNYPVIRNHDWCGKWSAFEKPRRD